MERNTSALVCLEHLGMQQVLVLQLLFTVFGRFVKDLGTALTWIIYHDSSNLVLKWAWRDFWDKELSVPTITSCSRVFSLFLQFSPEPGNIVWNGFCCQFTELTRCRDVWEWRHTEETWCALSVLHLLEFDQQGQCYCGLQGGNISMLVDVEGC
jgi:hypothetical protein